MSCSTTCKVVITIIYLVVDILAHFVPFGRLILIIWDSLSHVFLKTNYFLILELVLKV